MKKVAITITTALLVSILAVDSDDSSASRVNERAATAAVESVEFQTSERASLFTLIFNASSSEARAITDNQLEEMSVSEMLSLTNHPSTHFVGRLFSFIQSNELQTEDTLAAIAMLPTTPRTILNELSLHESDKVRAALAANPAISADLAANLLRKETREIRFSLALNTSFARFSKSEAADFINEIAYGRAELQTVLSASEVTRLLARTNYEGHVAALLSERTDATAARETAKLFIERLGQLS